MNDNIMTQMGFGQEVEDVHNGICPACKNTVDPTSFRDELSQREFKISGLCQACQDEIFGTSEEDYQDEDLQDEDLQDEDMYADEEDYSNAIPEEPEDFRDDDLYKATDIEEDYQDE